LEEGRRDQKRSEEVRRGKKVLREVRKV